MFQKRHLGIALLTLVATFDAPLFGELNTIDVVPAATLLVPHFAVDMAGCGSGSFTEFTTLVTISNPRSAPTIVQLTFWTDTSFATVDYMIYLDGFDIVSANLADMFCDGIIPQTGPGLNTPGPYSDAAIDFPMCADFFPPGTLSVNIMARLVNGHTGEEMPGASGQCAGFDYGASDTRARGYLTINVVNQCTVFFPSANGYFGGIASNENVILGQYSYVDVSENMMQTFPAVHIEADSSGTMYQDGDHTFYGRYVQASAIDRREPLPTFFQANYMRQTPAFDETQLVVWREGGADSATFPCGSPPQLASNANNLVVFNDTTDAFTATQALPLETSIFNVGSITGLTFNQGLIYIDLRHNGIVYSDDLAQGWVGTLLVNNGVYGGGSHAFPVPQFPVPVPASLISFSIR